MYAKKKQYTQPASKQAVIRKEGMCGQDHATTAYNNSEDMQSKINNTECT